MDLRTWNENIYEKKYVQFVPEQIEKVVDIYHRWQAAGTDGTNFAEPELYRSVGIEEIKENGWSLVPSRYIEFVDRDTNIDYESVMSEASKNVASLLARQEANDAALRKAFAALGFNLETKNKIKNYGNQ